MIAFGDYFYFMARDVEYIEARKRNSVPYPYEITVCFRSGHKISMTYMNEEDWQFERAELVRQLGKLLKAQVEEVK